MIVLYLRSFILQSLHSLFLYPQPLCSLFLQFLLSSFHLKTPQNIWNCIVMPAYKERHGKNKTKKNTKKCFINPLMYGENPLLDIDINAQTMTK